jgi:2-amino-4-hydroxy-6-hydroxymethyldihydropteridine diphosphokinase
MTEGAQFSKVWLGLGANLGDREAALQTALKLLARDCRDVRVSPVYETPPWGDTNQEPFLNLVACGQTSLSPVALLRRCQEIEHALGRQRGSRWGPREIDVDLLAYGDIALKTPELEIPHPQLHRRGFVLVPFVDVDPCWRHPLLDKTALELLQELPHEETAGIRLWHAAEPHPDERSR